MKLEKSVAEGDECCDCKLRDSRNGYAKRKAIIAGDIVLYQGYLS